MSPANRVAAALRGREALLPLLLAAACVVLAVAAAPAAAEPFCERNPTAPACRDEPPEGDPAPTPTTPRLESSGLGSFRDVRMTPSSPAQTVQVGIRETVTVSAHGGAGEAVRLKGEFRRTCVRGSVAFTEHHVYDGPLRPSPHTASWRFACPTASDTLSEVRLELQAEARTSTGAVISTAKATFLFTAAEQEYRSEVTEYQGQRQTDITVLPGDVVTLVGGGEIWAGVWLSGTNGPGGWEGDAFTQSPPYPTSTYPYALIAHLDGQWTMPDGTSGSGWFHVGAVRYVRYSGPPTRLRLGINDNAPGNGSGAFTALVLVKRGT